MGGAVPSRSAYRERQPSSWRDILVSYPVLNVKRANFLAKEGQLRLDRRDSASFSMFRSAFCLVIGFSVFHSASALTIVLDYGDDAATDNFFATHPVAKATLEKARNDLQAAITTTLAAATDTSSGSNGATTATYNFSLGYTNPSTGAAVNLADASLGADQVKIFVGMRELGGSTLGQGGPGSTGLSVGGSGSPAQWPGAVTNTNAVASTNRLRGGGPIISTLTGTVSLGGTPGSVSVQTGSAVGNLWFDNDSNNDTVTDTDPQLDAYWHFDFNTPVASGKSDFYSVALHEMLHVLGFGIGVSWNSNVSGTTWLGSEVTSLMGTGAGMVDGGGAHVASGVTSPRLSDGVLQETVMSPSIVVGTRKQLTQLDLAFMRDFGWSTITTVPEPGVAGLAVLGLAPLIRRRRNSHA